MKEQLAEQKQQLAEQKKQLEEMRALLLDQKRQIDSLKAQAPSAAPAKAAATVATAPVPPADTPNKMGGIGQVASLTPVLPPVLATPAPAPAAIPTAAAPLPAPSPQAVPESPLQLHLGAATITPVGFVDATNTWRSTNSGASLATNFGNYPYNTTLPQSRLSEDKMSLQNSRIGFRVDALFKDIHVLGYYEGDFVGGIGNGAFNTQVSSNSVLYRLRLFWVDLRKGKWEVLGGQSWSMMTPNRKQISPLPGDLFYGQEFDVNYLNGLTWGRIPGFRFLYHPNNKVTWGISAENASQYFGGSGGGGVPTLPAALGSLTSTELDANVVNGISLPQVHPDIISKIAFDPNSRVHFEVAGVLDTVKTFNPNQPPALGAQQHFTKTGGGVSVNGNFEVAKNFRLITNNFWSDGAGRYLFGEAPNFIIRADGSPSLVHSGSTVDGFEWTLGKSMIYGYYGGIFVGRNTALDANGTTLIGYGYRGSPNSQNRSMQEGTIGLTQTIFKDPRYGQVSFFLDYAYFWRNPWWVAPGAPKAAHQNAVWFDLRYTLPGAAPAITY
ncbi:MAG TPA: hypothetical protein VFA33_07105 [Bryobacteraceae bacterium]|nr:hypothetical protein [Bryobacteraceae bacterium]